MRGPGFYGQDFFIMKSEQDIVKENIIRILLTSPGERVMNNSFGCRLKNYLFDQPNVLSQEVEDEIKKSVGRWEPRVIVKRVEVVVEPGNVARVKVFCILKETLEDIKLDTAIRF